MTVFEDFLDRLWTLFLPVLQPIINEIIGAIMALVLASWGVPV